MSKCRMLAIENIKDIANEMMVLSCYLYDDADLDDASNDLEQLAMRLMDIYQLLRPEEL